MALRWGICSTGLIANDFVSALKTLPASDHQVVAVAAMSDQKKADSFAQKYDIPAAYGTYEELAEDPNVEIVYIGTQTPFHYLACLLYLENGKHVLCEKSLTKSLTQAEEILQRASEKKLFFMEGFWTRFYPAYEAAARELKTGSLGDIQCVQGALCVHADDVLSLHGRGVGTGAALWGIGCYPLLFVQQIFKGRPEKIIAVKQSSPTGGDQGVALTLQYKGGQVAQVYTQVALAQANSSITFMGTKGRMQLENLHTPTKLTLKFDGKNEEEKVFPLPETSVKFNWWNGIGFVYEAEAVRKCVRQGLMQCEEASHDDTLTIMYILEEASKQLGLSLPE